MVETNDVQSMIGYDVGGEGEGATTGHNVTDDDDGRRMVEPDDTTETNGCDKGGTVEDDQTQCGMDRKSRRLMMETTILTCVGDDFVLGAQSRIRVETTGRQKMGTSTGLDLNSSNEKEGGRNFPIGRNDEPILHK